MNITVDKQPNCSATLRAEIPSDSVRKERDSIVATFGAQARIQGFRPGKAPRKVIEKRFAEQISEELRSRLTRKVFEEALREHKLKVLEFGAPEGFTETPDGSMAFESTLTLAPEIQLPDYKGLTVKAPPTEITDAEVEERIHGLRERFAEYIDIPDRGAEEGDLLVIDYSSTLDGTPLEEAVGKPVGYLSGREDFWIKVDGESLLPGFAMQLVGAGPGDSRQVAVTCPDDFPVEAIRGRELVFEVAVKGLKSVRLPEADDDLAAKLGAESMEQLQNAVRDQAQYEKRRRIDDMKVNQIVDHFNSLVDFELPEDLLRDETQSQADNMVRRGIESGMNEEEIAERQQEIFATAGMQARTNLKTNFILQEIANAEDITVSDREMAIHLSQIATSRKENPKKFIQQLQREGRIPGIRNSMLVGKAIDFILEHATVEEIPAAPEDPPSES